MTVDEAAEIFEMLSFQHPFFLGAAKAGDLVRRLDPSLEDVKAWQASKLPRRIVVYACQRWKSPEAFERFQTEDEAEAEEFEAAKAQARGSVEKQEDDAMLRRGNLQLRRSREGVEGSCPPPVEFLEAAKRLKRGTA